MRNHELPPTQHIAGAIDHLPTAAEFLAAHPELAERIGHTATVSEFETLVQNPEIPATNPLPHDKEILKRDLGLSEGEEGDSQLESLAFQAEEISPHARIGINMPVGALEGFLREGKYVSAVDSGTGTSPNRSYDELRRGYRTEDEPQLVYGYLTSKETSAVEKPEVYSYGGVEITLKSDKIAESTFTAGDSMDPYQSKDTLRGFDDAVLLEESRKLSIQKGGVGLNIPYIEAQVHGGVETTDIEEISVPLHAETGQRTGEALRDTISLLHETLPEVKKVIKIDATEQLQDPSVILELAAANPDVEIEIIVRQVQEHGDKYRVLDPRFKASKSNNPDVQELADPAYDLMNSRMEVLNAGFAGILAKTGKEALPDNLKISKVVGDRSMGALKASHNSHLETKKAA